MPDSLEFNTLPAAQQIELALHTAGAVFVSGDTVLQVSSWNSLASVKLTIAGRFRNLDGREVPFSFAHTPNTDRTIKSTLHSLGDGWLLNVTACASSAAPIIGQTFVRFQLVRGLDTSGIVLATLAACYVTAVQPIAWPGSGVRSSLDGDGALRSIAGTNPAAGADISETVPTGARWFLHSLTATLVTDATVATRNIALVFDDGASELVSAVSQGGQAAFLTYKWSFTHNGAPFSTPQLARPVNPTTPVKLLAGWRIRTVNQNLAPADDWGVPQLLVEEWLEGAA